MKKYLGIVLALALVLSLSLVTAVPVSAQETITINDPVDATITRTDTLNTVTFDIEILSEDPVHGTYGVGVAFATSLDQPAFQVWYREYAEPVGWYYQDYGTGWDSEIIPLADKTGFSATGDLTGQTFSLSVPTTELGGFGATYYYAVQVRTNLLGSYPEGWSWGSPVTEYASVKLLVLNEDTGNLYGTIQGAINAASEGDTVIVAAGTYDENVVIDRSLTLQGEDRGTTEIKFGYDYYPSPSPLTISADEVTVSGLTIHSGPDIEPSWTIVVEGNSALLTDLHVIKDPLLWANNTPRIGGAAVLLGTPVGGSGVGGIDGFDFTDSTVDSAWNGIYAPRNPGSSDILVKKVDFTYPGEYAILLMMVTGATIEENTFTCTADQYGVTVTRGSDEIEIAGNQFVGSGSLADSHIGILLQAYAEGTMGDVVIVKNEISKFHTGILVEDVATSGISIHYNNITGNTCGVKYIGNPNMLDATNNYWGHASGPSHSPGSGDPVSGDVTYDPWLLESVVPGQPLPTLFDKTLVLNVDWTLVSTDNWIDPDPTKTVGVGVILAINYTSSEGWFEVSPADLKPVNALYLKTVDGGGLGIKYSGDVPIASSKNLEPGWNLISSATLTDAKAVLSPLAVVQIGDEVGPGLATLVSQGNYNQHTGSFYLATLVDADWNVLGTKMLHPFDGYWIYMNAGKPFGVVPK